MRDDSHRWDAPQHVAATGLVVRQLSLGTQVLVSEPSVLARYQDDLVGWPEAPSGPRYALSLRRDRVLLVGDHTVAYGFDAAANMAASDVSDAFDVIETTGPNALACLKHGAEIRLDQPSRSVARLVFGIGVYLYRAPDSDGFRLHVPRAMTTAFMQHLAEASR